MHASARRKPTASGSFRRQTWHAPAARAGTGPLVARFFCSADHKLPTLLHLPGDFRVSRMRNDGGFPFPSSPPTTSFAGNSESRTRSSNASAELEGEYGMDIFTTLQGCDSFQLGIFPPPRSPVADFYPTLNSSPGDGDVFMMPAATNPRPSSMTQIQPNNVAGCDKRMASSDSTGKRIASTGASKRLKTLENLHQLPCDESAAIHPQLMKAPVRRSQKLGDKITALQQLVSPFGKTDTASVLHEATICIKYLHERIQVLTAPQFRIKSSPHLQGHGERSGHMLYQRHGGESSGLQSRGFCLVPISSTIISLINQQENSSHSRERTTMATTAHFY